MRADVACSRCGRPGESWRRDGSVILACHHCMRIEGRGPHAKEFLDAFAVEHPFADVSLVDHDASPPREPAEPVDGK